MELTNNTILITGGTSGLGLTLATRLLAMGNTVIVTGRDPAKLEQTQQRLPGIHTVQSDVSQPEAIAHLYEQLTKQFPKLNMLINNAGEMRKINLQTAGSDLADITREVEINLMGPIRLIQQFMPQLKRQPSAAIMNVSSGLAFVPFPISPVYGATKSGLHSYTQSLRVQLKNTAINVFELVAPAAKTPFNDKFMGEDGFDPKTLMEPDKLVDAAIRGMQANQMEIYPGVSRIIKLMSRLAPKFILSQTSKVGAGFMAAQ